MGMAVMLAASMPMAVFADETVTGGGLRVQPEQVQQQ